MLNFDKFTSVEEPITEKDKKIARELKEKSPNLFGNHSLEELAGMVSRGEISKKNESIDKEYEKLKKAVEEDEKERERKHKKEN